MSDEIRSVISDHARLPVDVDTLADDADLFAAGMTSHASVNVMLALEDALRPRVPRPHAHPQRVREHRRRSRAASTELAARAPARMSVAVDSRSGLSGRGAPDRGRGRGAQRRRRRPRRRASRPRRSRRCARSGALSAAFPSSSAAAASRSRRSPRACFELGAPLRRDARWSSRCTRSRSSRSCATSTAPLVRGLPARPRRASSA